MSRRNVLLLGLVLTAVLSVLPRLFDRYEERIDLGPGPRALRNPFLAAQRFLESSGIDARGVRRWQQLDRFDQRTGTLILSDSRLILNEAQLERLLAWIAAGGNLIVGAPPPVEDEEAELDPLFERFELSSEAVEDAQDDQPRPGIRELLREIEAELRAAERPVPDEELTEVYFEGYDEPVRAHFAVPRYLYHPSLDLEEDEVEAEAGEDPASGSEVQLLAVVGNAHGAQILRFGYGIGRITVLVDIGLWDFRRIDRFDHAWLLYRLVDPERNGTAVRLLHDRAMPSLATLIGRHAAQPLLALALLLAAWLWHRGRRFGPAREPPAPGRRALVEHLQASGEYLWRHRLHLRLLDAMRAAVRARAPQVAETALPALLARRSGLPVDAVKQALRERPRTLGEQEFVELSRKLQQLRNSL